MHAKTRVGRDGDEAGLDLVYWTKDTIIFIWLPDFYLRSLILWVKRVVVHPPRLGRGWVLRPPLV